MVLFSKKTSENAQKIIDFLGCPCEYFPEGKPAQLIQSSYEDAYAVREMGGYTPVLITVNDMIAEWIDNLRDEEFKDGETPEQFRQRLLVEAVPDAQKWFTERLSEMKEEYGEYWDEITAESSQPGERVDKFCGFIDFSTKKSSEVILAKIPTNKPWEVFAWLPFGGWNECPDAAVMLSVGKYWYEKFHAIPAVITHDVLEFAARPVSDKSAAVGLALEQYAFCPDVIDQGCQEVGILADTLMNSSVWFFWWD